MGEHAIRAAKLILSGVTFILGISCLLLLVVPIFVTTYATYVLSASIAISILAVAVLISIINSFL